MARAMSRTGMPSVMATMTRDAGVGGLHDGVGGAGGGTKIMVALAPVLRDGLGDGVEQREAFLGRAALAGHDAADDLRAVVAALDGVEGAGLAQALAEDARCSCRRGCSLRLPLSFMERVRCPSGRLPRQGEELGDPTAEVRAGRLRRSAPRSSSTTV